MPSTAVVVETIELTLRVPKSALTMLAPLPATVTQHTVEHHFGIPQRLYKQMIREGWFPSKRIGRLIFAAYEDVNRVVTEGAQIAAAVAKEPEDDIPKLVSCEEARAYVAAGVSFRERRDRRNELLWRASDLAKHYAETRDGAPNPTADKVKYVQSRELFAAMAVANMRTK